MLDFLAPGLCVACAAVANPGTLCAGCFTGLQLITDPLCDSCGLPLALPGPGARVCDHCAAEPPLWRCARAALLYNPVARQVILPLKHAGREENAAFLAPLMARAGRALLADAGALVPVPLHRDRRIARRYNQSALLAQALARLARVPVWADSLRRTKATPMLGGLDRAARAQAMAGVIEVNPRRREAIAGAGLIVIDDVMTSGATAAACAQALLDAGAAHVDVLVVARVADPRATD